MKDQIVGVLTVPHMLVKHFLELSHDDCLVASIYVGYCDTYSQGTVVAVITLESIVYSVCGNCLRNR